MCRTTGSTSSALFRCNSSNCYSEKELHLSTPMLDTRINEGIWCRPVFFSILPYSSLKVLSNEMKINLKDNKMRQLLPRTQVINTYSGLKNYPSIFYSSFLSFFFALWKATFGASIMTSCSTLCLVYMLLVSALYFFQSLFS